MGDGNNGMLRRAVLVSIAALFVISGLAVTAPQHAEATSGFFIITPGQSYNVSFGVCGVNDLLLWDVWVSALNPHFVNCIRRPDGSCVGLPANTWGMITDQPGGWDMGFSVDNDTTEGVTVTYTVYHIIPSITIISPSSGAYVTEVPFDVAGSVDSWASSIRISSDGVNYTTADIDAGTWSGQMPPRPDGQYTIYAEETIVWGYYSATFSDSVVVTVDCTPPDLAVISPVIDSSNGTYLKGVVNISWQCSDFNGIAKREVRIDASGWQEVAADTYIANLADGNHVVTVRVTDTAGNAASSDLTFVCDTVAPQVMITQPGMNAKISKDHIVVYWTGSDDRSGIDHYEVRITDGEWVAVGNGTSYEFTSLDDGWYSVNVRAVDESGNSATSTVGFGIFTSVWSQDGPYHGIPLYVLVGVLIAAAVVGYALAQRRTKSVEPPPEEEL